MESNPQGTTEETNPTPPTVDEPASSDEVSATGPQEYGIAQATVVRLTENAAVVSFGWKAEGRIPFEDFDKVDGKPAVKVGDTFEALVEVLDEQPEKSLLSQDKARKLRTWDAIARLGKGSQIQGTVVSRVPGGYSVDIGMNAFLPSAQADVKRLGNPESLVGQTLGFVISEFDKRRGKIVLGRRVLLEKEQAARKQETLAKIKEGAVLPGVVKSLAEYGAFVDLGGVDGLLHVTEMSWGRVGHPREVLKVGQELNVQVLKYDAAAGKIGLGLKQLLEDPWAKVPEKYREGTEVTGKVVNLADFGAFVELERGVEGLVHVSEISWKRIKHPSNELKVGQKVKAVVLHVDTKARRIGLGMRQLQPNPWVSVKERFPTGTVIKRRVRGVTDFGVFLGVEDGIDGLVHISEMSWTGGIKHPGDLYKVGDEVEAMVLDVDVDSERLSLSIKAMQPDPWQTLVTAHPIGSRLKGKVTRIADFGAFVEIEPGIEGLVHISQLSEERVESVASVVKVGDEIEVQVLDINARDRKVSLSVRALTEVPPEEYTEQVTQHQGDARTSLGDVFGDKLRKFKRE